MIFNKDKSFCFIHIPKNGGMFIRDALNKIDGMIIFNGLRQVNDKYIDFSHLTLDFLKNNYPKIFKRIITYEIVAIWRDPVDRFHSAMAQHIRNYKKIDFFNLTKEEYKALCLEKLEEIKHIQANNIAYDYENIHFAPQTQFTCHDNKQIVCNLYDIKHIETLSDKIKSKFFNQKIDFKGTKVNQSFVYKFRFNSNAAKILRFFYNLVPQYFRKSLKKLIGYFLFTTPKNKFEIENLSINKHIRNFYKEDYTLSRK